MSNSQDTIKDSNSAADRKHTMGQKMNALRERRTKIEQANDAALMVPAWLEELTQPGQSLALRSPSWCLETGA